jgi:ribosomal RNA assembly protein
MQQLYITEERLRALKGEQKALHSIERACSCKLSVEDEMVEISGSDAFLEFTAKNILYAFGRGFAMEDAMKLRDPDCYFKLVDLKQIASNAKRVKQIKARIIGIEGRAKKYIEQVSMAKISVYGDTVGMIGSIEQTAEAETAINTLVDGGTHKLAYLRMETMHRNHKAAIVSAKF